jgi:hypothetical protein
MVHPRRRFLQLAAGVAARLERFPVGLNLASQAVANERTSRIDSETGEVVEGFSSELQ